MWFNPFLAQEVGKERMKDALREAEQERLIRAANGPRKPRGWRPRIALMLGSLLGLLMRPQS